MFMAGVCGKRLEAEAAEFVRAVVTEVLNVVLSRVSSTYMQPPRATHSKGLQIWLNVLLSPSCGEGNGTPLQSSCLENPRDRGAWRAAVHGLAEGWTRLSDFTFTFHFHALEKATAPHSSTLAWRIPWTEEPGGLPSLGSGVAQTQTQLKRLSS